MKLISIRKRRYRETWLLLSAMFLFTVLTGCGRAGAPKPASPEGGEGKLKVVTTLFPYYDFTRQVAGDKVELSMVIPAGMDSHSFEPTPADLRLIREADVLICNGGAMEQWVGQVLDSLDVPGLKVVTMMDHVDVVEEEFVEGMEDAAGGHIHGDHAEPHESADAPDHGEQDGGRQEYGGQEYGEQDHDGQDHDDHEYDEHIWTSPLNAVKITETVAQALCGADPENAAAYEEGKRAYTEKLLALDREFRELTSGAEHRLIIMADRFPLRYFADEYGLEYRAAFSGCSTDTEPSAKTIAYLIDRVRDEKLKAVYYLELSSPRVAEIIGEETGAEPLLFHSCHNVTRREFENGVTYLELMENNVENLRLGLN